MMVSFFNKGDKGDEVVNAEKERKAIRQKIRSDLRHKLKFADAEIQEVVDIIDRSEREIDFLKTSLSHVNMNNDDTETDVIMTTRLIREEGEKMALGIKQKTAEILLRKRKEQ